MTVAATAVAAEERKPLAPYAAMAFASIVMLASVNLATPIYAVFRERFGFSIAVLPLIFAAYALVLVPTLLVFGQVSDRFGRRPVIVGGIGLLIAALVVFAFAQGTAWLFVARVLQGLGVGVSAGAASAALVELEPRHDRGRAALVTTLTQAGGSALGPVLAGMLAEWAPWPHRLCFLAGGGLAAVAALGVLAIAEPVRPPTPVRKLTRPSVPAEIRLPFLRAGITAASVWAVAGLFLSVVPTYAGRLLDTHNLALLGAITAIMLGASCLSQGIWQRTPLTPARAQPLGLGLLACALGALVLAFPTHSLALVLVAASLGGVGHGLGFLGAQADVNELAPPERRGEVTAAFYAIIYFGVAIPVIGVGLLAAHYSLYTGVVAFAIVTGGVAAATAIWHLRGELRLTGRAGPPAARRVVATRVRAGERAEHDCHEDEHADDHCCCHVVSMAPLEDQSK